MPLWIWCPCLRPLSLISHATRATLLVVEKALYQLALLLCYAHSRVAVEGTLFKQRTNITMPGQGQKHGCESAVSRIESSSCHTHWGAAVEPCTDGAAFEPLHCFCSSYRVCFQLFSSLLCRSWVIKIPKRAKLVLLKLVLFLQLHQINLQAIFYNRRRTIKWLRDIK